MKAKRKIIEIDEELCNGCGQCVPDCAEGSLRIIDGKARLVADKLCDGLGACLGSCPTGALRIIEREADAFDEAAVEAFLAEQGQQSPTAPPAPKPHSQGGGHGCPSAGLHAFPSAGPCQAANSPRNQQTSSDASALSHWPLQIRLIPASAPFLAQADVLIVADCAALAYPTLHQDFVAGRVVMMGCPKFDDQQLYVQRLSEIFSRGDIRSLTVLIMEVPCCHSMLSIIKAAYSAAKADFPVRQAIISIRGELQAQQDW